MIATPLKSISQVVAQARSLGSLVYVVVGLVVMYGMTAYDFMHGPWQSDRSSHGPIVLAMSAWYFYFHTRRISRLPGGVQAQPSPVLGWVLVVMALALYVLGRSQEIALLELGSLVPMLVGLVIMVWGRHVAGQFWFAFFLLCFAVPLPASIVDMATQPMKIAVSYSSEWVLHTLGYPVARSGVIITIGSYQLLVADACAGLNSLFTLEALGLLYMNVIRHESVFRNITLAVLIVPISFTANVTRVMVLSLLTYHFGDDAGQGFMHEFSGMVLFLTALMLIVATDTALRSLSRMFQPKLRAA